MDKYRILNNELYVNFVKDNYADEGTLVNKLKKSSPKLLMQRLIENNESTDLQIKIGKWSFDCHLSVLQCYATYFKRDCFRTDRIAELPVEQVSPTTFTKIYDWMIIDEPKVQREEIIELFISAYYLGIKTLIEQIWACLGNEEYIYENEAFLLYYEAALAHVQCIKELMLKRISKFFLIMVAFREFVFMSVDDLCCLTSSDIIGVNTEIEVFMACLRWLTYKWSERKRFLLKIMRQVRFGLIPPGFLIELDRDMIDHPVIKSVMCKPKIKQLVVEGLKLATTQFCYGSSLKVKPRQWLYDEKCDYHLKVNQLIEYKITYDKFQEYLFFLQKCSKDHWRAFVYIKTENQSLPRPMDLRHLQLLQNSSKTCIVQTADNFGKLQTASNSTSRVEENVVKKQAEPGTKKSCPNDAKIESIISYQEWKACEKQNKGKSVQDRNNLKKPAKSVIVKYRRCTKSSTESSSSESFSPRVKSFQGKRFLKKKSDRKTEITACKTINVEKIRSNHEKEFEEDLSLDIPTSNQQMDSSTDDANSSSDKEDGESMANQRALAASLPTKYTSFPSDDETYFDTELATDSKVAAAKQIISNNQNKDSKQEEKMEVFMLQESKVHKTIKIEVKENQAQKYDVSLLKKSNHKNYKLAEEENPKPSTSFKSLFKNKTLLILGGTDPFTQTCERSDPKNSRTFIDKVLLYNDKFQQWVKLPHTAFGVRHHHAAVVCQGLVYVIGGTKVLPGCKKAFFETSIWSFNPKTKIWKFATNLPQNRRDFAALAIDGKNNEVGFLVIGGETFDRAALNSVWLYKVNEKVWERKASLNIGRYGFAATIIDGKDIWIGGGVAFSSNTAKAHADGNKKTRHFTDYITDTIECFSLNGVFDNNFKGKWIKLPCRLPNPCLYGKFCTTTANELFLIGGFGAADSSKTLKSFSGIYRFSLKNKIWSKCGSLKYARHGHDVVIIDDFIVIIGGVSSPLNHALRSIEMFSTTTNAAVNLIPNLPWPISGLAAVIVRGEY